jgi:hypothetical protein
MSSSRLIEAAADICSNQSCYSLALRTAVAAHSCRCLPLLVSASCPLSAPCSTTNTRCFCPTPCFYLLQLLPAAALTHRISRVFCRTPFAS